MHNTASPTPNSHTVSFPPDPLLEELESQAHSFTSLSNIAPYDSLFPLDADSENTILENFAQVIPNFDDFINDPSVIADTWLYKPIHPMLEEETSEAETASVSTESGHASTDGDTPESLEAISQQTWSVLYSNALRQEEAKLFWLLRGPTFLREQKAALTKARTKLAELTTIQQQIESQTRIIAGNQIKLTNQQHLIKQLGDEVRKTQNGIVDTKHIDLLSVLTENEYQQYYRDLDNVINSAEIRDTQSKLNTEEGDLKTLQDPTIPASARWAMIIEKMPVLLSCLEHQYSMAQRQATDFHREDKASRLAAYNKKHGEEVNIDKLNAYIRSERLRYPQVFINKSLPEIMRTESDLATRLLKDSLEDFQHRILAVQERSKNVDLVDKNTPLPRPMDYLTRNGQRLSPEEQKKEKIQRENRIRQKREAENEPQEIKVAGLQQAVQLAKKELETLKLAQKNAEALDATLSQSLQKGLEEIGAPYSPLFGTAPEKIQRLLAIVSEKEALLTASLSDMEPHFEKHAADISSRVDTLQTRYREVFTPERCAFLQQVFSSSFTDADGEILTKSGVLQSFFTEILRLDSPTDLSSYEKEYITAQISQASYDNKRSWTSLGKWPRLPNTDKITGLLSSSIPSLISKR